MAKPNPLTKCFVSLIVAVCIVAVVFSEISAVSGEPVDVAHSCIHIYKDGIKGNSTPIILLHGLTDFKNTWFGFYQVLAMKTRRRICIYDARNHGDSPWSDDMSLDSLTEDLDYLMDRLDIPKAILLGHSLGGKTAMNFALTKPDKVEKLIVEDMRPNNIEPNALKLVAFLVQALNDSIGTVPHGADETSATLLILEYMNKQLKDLSPETPLTVSSKMQFPVECSNGTCWWKTNFKVAIPAINNPKELLRDVEGLFSGETLFIYGEASPLLVNEDKKNILELFPKAQLVGIKGASHVIHNEFPEFLEEVLKFLKSSDNE